MRTLALGHVAVPGLRAHGARSGAWNGVGHVAAQDSLAQERAAHAGPRFSGRTAHVAGGGRCRRRVEGRPLEWRARRCRGALVRHVAARHWRAPPNPPLRQGRVVSAGSSGAAVPCSRTVSPPGESGRWLMGRVGRGFGARKFRAPESWAQKVYFWWLWVGPINTPSLRFSGLFEQFALREPYRKVVPLYVLHLVEDPQHFWQLGSGDLGFTALFDVSLSRPVSVAIRSEESLAPPRRCFSAIFAATCS